MAIHDLLKDEIFAEELDAYKLSHAEDSIYYYIENRNNIPQEKQWYEKTYLTNKNLEQIIEWYNSLSFEEVNKIKKRKISDNPRIAAIQKETLFELEVAESYYNDEFFQKFC
jgi:predicted Zn-dependent peptidase